MLATGIEFINGQDKQETEFKKRKPLLLDFHAYAVFF